MDSPAGTGTAGDQRVVAGRYRLLSPLGSGGMGTVWRALDTVLGREVAVKEVMPPRGLSEEDRGVLFERTRREARAAARLDHPSAVTVFDVVEDGGSPFLVMELVEGRTLSDVVRRDGPLRPQQAGAVGLCVLGALAAAHAQGIVHRDVKPGNVLLELDGGEVRRVVLTDFGIATSAGDSSITSTGLLLGSPSYIAPERARGQQPGPASDLWSLGATLFTAVEGRPPYDAGDPLATVTAVVTGEHAPFLAAGPLEPVITGLLERDPAQRLDADAARVMLEQVVRGAESGPAPRPQPAPVRRTDRTSALPMREVAAAAAATRRTALPPRPGPAPARSRRGGTAALVAAGVFVVALLVGGVALLGGLGGGDDDAGTSAAPTAGPTAAPSAGASASAAPLERPAGVPADWQAYEHPGEGWALFHPASYARSERRSLTQFRDEATRYTLRVGTADAASALAAEQAVDASFSAALGGYQRLRLEQTADGVAELEFTYSDSGADLRALHRAVERDGRVYTLWWQTNADRFAASLPQFEALADAFVAGR